MTSSNKIIFKCDQHATIISNQLRSFYEENEFFDTELVSGSDSIVIQAHRVVLCAMSEYFLQIFRAGKSDLKANVVELKEIEFSTLKLIINFMYSGSIELSLETVEGILRTASFLKIKTLVDGCCGLILKNIDCRNSLKRFRLAYELNLPTLKANALECTYTHFEEISKENDLLSLSENELKDLLFNDNPHGDIEEDVFLSMVAWINYDKSNREHILFELLSMVRFQALTPKFIVENRKSVCKTVESYELICSWLQWHLSPETRSNDQRNCEFKPRKMADKIAVVKVINSDTINIETFNPKVNSWSIEFETSLRSKKRCYSIIDMDSKLFVLGSPPGVFWTNEVEYFDKQTFGWIDLPQMKNNRMFCQLADLKGYLCVFGGDFNTDPSLELYNLTTCKWNNVELMYKASTSSRVSAYNGILYILDFENGCLQSYDVSSNKWTAKTVEKDSLRYYGFSAVEGFLYVFGGLKGEDWLKTVRRYNLSDDSWSQMASLPHVSSNIKTTVYDNKIIICNSSYVDEYNIDTDTWNTLSLLKEHDVSEFINVCIFPVKIK